MTTTAITTKLLHSHIRQASTNGLTITLTDTELRGFGARISPTGRVTWIATKSIGKGKGSMQRVVLGHYPGMNLDAARLEAGLTISRLAKGEDVVSQVKQAKRDKVERLSGLTLIEAYDTYISEWSAKSRRSASGSYRDKVQHVLKNAVAALGNSTRVNAVTKADVRSLLKTHKDAGHFEAARWLFSQLRPFFEWCVHEEIITLSPCNGVVPPDAAKERQHKLLDAEIVALMSCAIPYYRVLLLTAQRRTEVASMQWCELNLDRREWVIPSSKTKNGREHLVPLSPAVVSILRPLRGERKLSEYVFGKYADAPFSGFSKATRELQADMLAKLREDDAEAEQSDWRIHDLRRTAASGMAALRVQPHIIEAVLNHTVSKLQRTYQVYLYADEKRQALELWADHLAQLCAPKDSNVTPIPFQKRFS